VVRAGRSAQGSAGGPEKGSAGGPAKGENAEMPPLETTEAGGTPPLPLDVTVAVLVAMSATAGLVLPANRCHANTPLPARTRITAIDDAARMTRRRAAARRSSGASARLSASLTALALAF